MKSWLEQARTISKLSVSDCAQALCQNDATYKNKESNPGTLTLNELRVLMLLFNKEAQRVVWAALEELGS